MKERYSRQIMLDGFGREGQKRLSEAVVMIVGVGGLGSAASIYLAGAGVGTLRLIDSDEVNLSNLQRQVLYATSMVGQPKVDMAAARLNALNPDVYIELCQGTLDAENAPEAMAGVDLVLDCTDNFAARYAIDDGCAAAGVPWVHASIGEFDGCVAIFNGHAGVRYSDLYPDRDELCSQPRRVTGVLGAVAGTVGAIQASEAVKYITGLGPTLDGRLFSINLLTMQSHTFDLCPI